jgi:hypothetical protein
MGWKGMDTEFLDVVPQTPAGICCTGCCSIVNLVLIILFFPCTIQQLGQYRIGILKNSVTGYVNLDESYVPGRYWIGFWKEFITFPSTLNTIEFSDESPEEGVYHLGMLKSRDRDGKQVQLDISVQYRLNPAQLGNVYKDYLLSYEDIYISELRDGFAKAANQFPIEDTWMDYPSVAERFRVQCNKLLSERYAECWGLQLWGVTLTSKYEAKLILTQVRKQAIKTEEAMKSVTEVRSKTQVLLAEYGKNVTIIKSAGEAEKYRVEREAFATAQANIIEAQAQALQIVRDRVCPEYAKEDLAGNITCQMPGWVMSSKQLIGYQKMGMLKAHNSSNLIYNMKGGSHPQAMNVQAARNIMAGRSRRLLLLNEMEGKSGIPGTKNPEEAEADHEL